MAILRVDPSDFGIQEPEPPAGHSLVVNAPPTYSGAPTVASAPTAGQGFALDSAGRIPTSIPATAIQVLAADPPSPAVGQIWYRSDTSALSVRVSASTTKRVTLS